MEDGLAVAFAKGIVKLFSVVLREYIPSKRLASVLVYPLENLVCGGVSETREEREEAAGDGSIGSVFKDDLVELSSRSDLAVIAHQALGGGVDLGKSGKIKGAMAES